MMISLLHISLLYVLHIFSIYDSYDLKVLGRRLYGVFLFFVYFMDCLKEHWRFFIFFYGGWRKREIGFTR